MIFDCLRLSIRTESRKTKTGINTESRKCADRSSAHYNACSAVIGQYRVQWRHSPPLAARLVPAPVH